MSRMLVSARLTNIEYLEIRTLVDDGEYMSMADFTRYAIRNELKKIKSKQKSQ